MKLNTIQKRGNLNDICTTDEKRINWWNYRSNSDIRRASDSLEINSIYGRNVKMKLNTIQKRGNLNDICTTDEKGNGNAHHSYEIYKANTKEIVGKVQFQHGARFEEGSTNGIATMDLLEICRNQLTCFQNGEFATKENEMALNHVEEALLWLNKRAEDRLERKVLGTTKL